MVVGATLTHINRVRFIRPCVGYYEIDYEIDPLS